MDRGRYEKAERVNERWNRIFDALSAEPRRQLVAALLDASPTQSVSLPEGATNPAVPVDRNSLRRELHHRHLPLLADLRYVRWETDPLAASRGPRFEEVGAVLAAVHANADEIPDPLVVGCRRLERERRSGSGE